MRKLQKTAKDAYQAGGNELYLPTLTSGPLPLSSLLVSFPMPRVMPSPANVHVHTVAETLRQSGADITLVTLTAAGKAVREFRTEAASPVRS